MKKTILALLGITLILGCKKPLPNPEPLPEKKIKLLTTRTLNYNGHYILQKSSYLENDLLKKEVSTDETTGINLIQEYFYTGSLPEYSIVSNDTRKVTRINYIHTGTRLTRMDYLEYDQAGALSLNFSKTFEYTANKVSKITTLSVQNTPISYEVFTFYGENAFAVKAYSASGVIKNVSEYLYDTQHNPFRGNHDKNQLAMGMSENNTMRVRYTDYINPAASSDLRYEYEYNSDNYPVKKMFIGTSGRELQISFTYQNY